MPNVMVALPNIGGTVCSRPQSLAKVRTDSSTEFGSNPILIDRIRIESAARSNPVLIFQIRTALNHTVDFNECSRQHLQPADVATQQSVYVE